MMLRLKSKTKLIFVLVTLFVVTFSVSLIVLAYNSKSGTYWRIGNPGKLCDYTIAANLPVARFDGANEWYLESGHWLSIQSYGQAFDYWYGWGHGWCPADQWHEGDWWDCDDYDPHPDQHLDANDSASHSRYNWAYDEYADVNKYRAVASSAFRPDGRYFTSVNDKVDVNR